jgi:AcrR family transcriptional regulator
VPESPVARPYRGIAANERVAARRAALIQAGLDVFQTEGWTALSARRVCEAAGLTRRYFYESFRDLDELVTAIYVSITTDISTAIRAAPQDQTLSFEAQAERAAAAGLAALEPAVKGRFLLAAQRAGGAVGPHEAAIHEELAKLVGRALLATRGDRQRPIESMDATIASRMVLGATISLLDSWLRGEIALSRAEISARVARGAAGIIDAFGRQREASSPS